MALSRAVNCQERAVMSARETGIAVNSAIETFLTRTARLDDRRRLPLQAGQTTGDM